MGCASSAPPPHNMANGNKPHQAYPTHQQQQPVMVHQQQQQQQGFPPQPPPQQPPYQQQQPPYQQQQPPYQQHPPRAPGGPPPPQQQQMPPQQQVPPPKPQTPPQPPPQPAAQQKPAESTIKEEEEPAPVEINQALVDSLLGLEQQIAALERKNVIKQYELKSDQVNRLAHKVQEMVRMQQQLTAQTQKEYQDVVDLSQNSTTHQMMSQVQFAAQISKEQEEYMQALNRQEIHKKELDACTRQLEGLKQTLGPIQKESEDLKQLYDKQDSLLGSIFNGKYGSEKEYKLESSLDLIMEKKQRISVAKYKWNQSRNLLSHAVGQMGFAIRRWTNAIQVPTTNVQLRYTYAAEARNNLVAASQNIASAQGYLNTIKFPYCTPDEVKTLNLAITHIFTDLLTAERHRHAMECYVSIYKRSAALVQWFDHVINKTILKDSQKIHQECANLQKELKQERMILIKEKVRTSLGDDAADSITVAESKPLEESEEPEIAMLGIIEADTVSQAGDLAEADKGETDENAPTPLPLDELAPAPNMDDIFGNIEELKKQHEEQQKEYEKQQEVAKTRANAGLQEKLAQRRSRRLRQQANEAEIQALASK